MLLVREDELGESRAFHAIGILVCVSGDAHEQPCSVRPLVHSLR
jgi:hypothetical protein